MHKDVIFSIFGEKEEQNLPKIRKIKDKLLSPLVSVCVKYGIKPDTISYLGLLMVLPFIYFFSFNPGLALLFILLNIFFDSLDGAVARKSSSYSIKGDVLDHTIDNVSFFIIFMTFFYYGLFSPFWGAVYILNYVILLFLIIIARGMKLKVFPVIFRSKWYVYLIFFVWLVSGINIFDPFLVLVSVYMFITNLFLFKAIKCSL